MGEILEVKFSGDAGEQANTEVSRAMAELSHSIDTLGNSVRSGPKNEPQTKTSSSGFREIRAADRRSVEEILRETGQLPPEADPTRNSSTYYRDALRGNRPEGPAPPPLPGELPQKPPPAAYAPKDYYRNAQRGVPQEGPAPPPKPGELPPPPPVPQQKPWDAFATNRVPQIVGSFTAAKAGEVTGSPTVGGLVGTGASMLTEKLAATSTLAAASLGALVVAATATAEVFHKVDEYASHFSETLKDFDPRVARAYGLRERAMVQQSRRDSALIGGITAQYAQQQTRSDVEWEKFKSEMVRGLLPVLMDMKEVLLVFVTGIRQLIGFGNNAVDAVQGAWDKLPEVAKTIMEPLLPYAVQGVLELRKIRKNSDKPLGNDTPEKWLQDMIKEVGKITDFDLAAPAIRPNHPLPQGRF
jgi:hypothetical protein